MSVAQLQKDAADPVVRNPGPTSEQLRLLEAAIVEEMLNAAMLTAVTTSIVNALRCSYPACSFQMASCYLPPQPKLFPQAILELSMSTATHATAMRLSTWYDRLRLLRDLLNTVVRLSQLDDRPLHLDVAATACSWQELAADARSIIEDIALSGRACTEAEERLGSVADLLERASAGGTPCLSINGNVELPTWAERRSRSRSVRNMRVTLYIGDGIQSAAVLDVSDQGLGVLGLRDVYVGQPVRLMTRPGACIEGRVVWVNDARCGIELAEPLPANSQLRTRLH